MATRSCEIINNNLYLYTFKITPLPVHGMSLEDLDSSGRQVHREDVEPSVFFQQGKHRVANTAAKLQQR